MAETRGIGSPAGTLVVPLDGVLCRTDTRAERRVQAVAGRPLASLRGVPPPALPASALPLDTAVLERVRAARTAGRRTVLATAGDPAQAEALAAELGLFDEVAPNLPPDASRATLEERYGAEVEHLVPEAGTRAGNWNAALMAMRPHQWSKNALVFLPVSAAHAPGGLGAALAAFVAFSLTASSVYVLNDIADLAADRAHPRKRFRPFAAGMLSVGQGLRLAAGLILGALVVALLFAPPLFLGVLVGYYVITFAYSLWLKRKLVIDVITLAGLYTIRIVAGAAATGIALSPWMLGFSMFIFLSLAAVKRQAELTDMERAGVTSLAGRAYMPDDLPVIRAMALSAGYAAVLVFALYINSEEVQLLYSRPDALWLICPLLLYWISRIVMKTHRGMMTDDPIVYAATDRVSLVTGLTGAAIFGAAGVL
jgi:4-hydroxybenzoate polyprenyltransferase